MTPGDEALHILVVDDSALVLRFAEQVLKTLNIPLHTFLDGSQALEYIRQNPVDLIVTDLMMPELDGFGLIAAVREEPAYRNTHIIVMTALDQVEDKVRALKLGANDYTVKPLDANEFRARVQGGLREIRLKKQLTRALADLDDELKLVANLQQRLLPKTLPQGDHFQSAVVYEPCSRAGGDYYDWFTDDGRLMVAVADVSGHGASAAVLMGMVRALLKVLVAGGGSAADVIGRLNRALLDNIGDYADFVTAFLGFIDPDRRLLNFCSAGHGDMMLLGPEEGRIQLLPTGGTVLGFFEGRWEESTVRIEPGQSLVLYTDGLVEAVNPGGEEFGRQRLQDLLISLGPDGHPSRLVNDIRAEINRFTGGGSPADDITLFVVKFL